MDKAVMPNDKGLEDRLSHMDKQMLQVVMTCEGRGKTNVYNVKGKEPVFECPLCDEQLKLDIISMRVYDMDGNREPKHKTIRVIETHTLIG